MPKCSTGTTSTSVAGRRTGANREVFIQEAINNRRVNVFYLFILEPEVEMGQTAQIDIDGAIGIALFFQRLDVGWNEALELTISKPIVANKVRDGCIGGHDLLL